MDESITPEELQMMLEEKIESAIAQYLNQETPEAEMRLTAFFKLYPQLTSKLWRNYCSLPQDIDEF